MPNGIKLLNNNSVPYFSTELPTMHLHTLVSGNTAVNFPTYDVDGTTLSTDQNSYSVKCYVYTFSSPANSIFDILPMIRPRFNSNMTTPIYNLGSMSIVNGYIKLVLYVYGGKDNSFSDAISAPDLYLFAKSKYCAVNSEENYGIEVISSNGDSVFSTRKSPLIINGMLRSTIAVSGSITWDGVISLSPSDLLSGGVSHTPSAGLSHDNVLIYPVALHRGLSADTHSSSSSNCTGFNAYGSCLGYSTTTSHYYYRNILFSSGLGLKFVNGVFYLTESTMPLFHYAYYDASTSFNVDLPVASSAFKEIFDFSPGFTIGDIDLPEIGRVYGNYSESVLLIGRTPYLPTSSALPVNYVYQSTVHTNTNNGTRYIDLLKSNSSEDQYLYIKYSRVNSGIDIRYQISSIPLKYKIYIYDGSAKIEEGGIIVKLPAGKTLMVEAVTGVLNYKVYSNTPLTYTYSSKVVVQ